MAGATIAASGALACGLGEACVRISRSRLEAAEEQAAAQRVAARLAECRGQLEALVDEDGAAITGFETLRDAEAVRQAQDRLCHMPLEMGSLAAEAAALLQEFRPLVRGVQDDLEMAITLLAGAAAPRVCCWTPTCASGRRRACWRNMSRRSPGFESRRGVCGRRAYP